MREAIHAAKIAVSNDENTNGPAARDSTDDLDHLLTERDRINQRLQEVIDQQTSAWGVKVTSVEVRDIKLPDTMQRAMAKQAEAEREKRAKIIHADGEFTAMADEMGASVESPSLTATSPRMSAPMSASAT